MKVYIIDYCEEVDMGFLPDNCRSVGARLTQKEAESIVKDFNDKRKDEFSDWMVWDELDTDAEVKTRG